MVELTADGLVVCAVPPVVYFDHFALRKFAGDETLAARLVAVLKGNGGTLAVSWLNLGEYATVTYRDQRLDAERLLERIRPAIFPIDVDPSAVSTRERTGEPLPHADRSTAMLFVRNGDLTPSASGLDLRSTPSRLFEPLNAPLLIASKDGLARKMRQALEKSVEVLPALQAHREGASAGLNPVGKTWERSPPSSRGAAIWIPPAQAISCLPPELLFLNGVATGPYSKARR